MKVKNYILSINQCRNRFVMQFVLVTFCGLGFFINSAYASGGDVSSIDTALQGLIDILTGKSARLIAVLTIAGVGYMTLCGRLPIKHAVYVCLGIGIIFGATTIASLLGA